MFEVLDLPKYLSENGNKVNDVKVLCVLNKQISVPNHLKEINKSNSTIASLVDLIGIEIKGKKYLVKGQVVVMLGPRAYEPIKGKRYLLLEGSAFLKDASTNYVEVLVMYHKNNSYSLYATKTLFREYRDISKVYPQFTRYIEELDRMNWDFDLFFDEFALPYTYRVCGSGCVFEDVPLSEQFIYKSEMEYKRSQVQGVAQNNNVESSRFNDDKQLNRRYKRLEGRNDILILPKEFERFSDITDKASNKVNEELSKLSQLNGKFDFESDVDYLYHALKDNWRKTPSPESATGRAILKNVLEDLYPEYKSRYADGIPFIESALDKNNILNIWHTGEVPEKLKDNFFYYSVANLKEKLYIAVIDYLLSLRGHLVEAFDYGESLSIDMYSVLKHNPYYLSLIDNRLTIEDLDKLGMLYNVNLRDKKILRLRNAAYLHNFMLDTSNFVVEENTIIEKEKVLKSIFNGIIISSKAYANLNATGCIISEKILHNLKFYIDPYIHSGNFVLPKTGWKEKKVKSVTKYVFPIFQEGTSDEVLRDYLDIGLGIEYTIDGVDYIVDYTYAEKERYIITRLYDLQVNGNKRRASSEEIERCIRAFERLKSLEWNIPDFSLEERQKDAVRILYNPVMCLTGPAGSGKTTTAEAMLFALQALYDIKEEDIMFCAPTGKAATRLREIVKKPTRTINSLFGIGNESYTLLDGKSSKKSEIKVLIVDEASMINLNLMYNMISKISDNTRIIFLGDKAQLPPIGPGKPFTNILTFLPCVVLNVLKRSTENSGISRNCNALLEESDGEDIVDLQQYDDFRLLETPKDRIIDLVKGIVNYHLGGAGEKRTGDTLAARRVLQSLGVDLDPDDIQVITPVNKYEWGTRNLNPILQDVFNPRQSNIKPAIRYSKGYEYIDNERVDNVIEYRINDRVIHLENMAHADRYLMIGKNTFEKISTTFGVMNGDVGKVVDFIKGSDLKFITSSGDIDEYTKETFADTDDVLYMAVKYQDVDDKGSPLSYVIFYKTLLLVGSEYDTLRRSENIYTVESHELKNLDLAYALTVHKLQGSQAKLTIFILYSVGFGSFISRNMIYTGASRAEQGTYLVGNVTGWNNAITKGRKIEQNILRDTITDKIFGV